MADIVTALTVNASLGIAAYINRSLSLSGLIAGVAIGSAIYYCGGPEAWLVMGAFFVSSTLLGRYKKSAKAELSRLWEKGNRRDYLQVMANGGAGCAAAVLHRLTGEPLFIILLAATFASSNADTWASEIGSLSRKPPVSIATLKPVPRGTSGGVSPLGLAATFAGSAFIAAVHTAAAIFFRGSAAHLCGTAALILFGGITGSLIDSLLGATVQGQYYCRETDNFTEKRTVQGVPATLVKGVRFMNNDMVNFSSSLGAAAITLMLGRCLSLY